MQKLYCYIDESGQDTDGKLFIVSAVIAGTDRDSLLLALEDIEKQSGKGKVKWIGAKAASRAAYMEAALTLTALKGCLHYSIYQNTKEYLALTVLTAAKAILAHAQADYKATVLIDALQDAHVQRVGAELRLLHVRTRKIRGVKKDETDAFIRLADALCGLIRDAPTHIQLREMLTQAEKMGVIKAL